MDNENNILYSLKDYKFLIERKYLDLLNQNQISKTTLWRFTKDLNFSYKKKTNINVNV
jgi:transposase